MINDKTKEKLKNNQPLEYHEIKNTLNYLMKESRKRHNIKNPYATDCIICQDINATLQELCDTNDIFYFPITTPSIGLPGLTHYLGTIAFNTENGPRWFLEDLTYSQFFTKSYYFDSNEEYAPAGNYMKSKKKDAFATQLRYYGYMDFTIENFKMYLDGFIDAYNNSHQEKINPTSIYQKAETFLINIPAPFCYTSEETLKQDKSFFKPIEGKQLSLLDRIQKKQQNMLENTKKNTTPKPNEKDVQEVTK